MRKQIFAWMLCLSLLAGFLPATARAADVTLDIAAGSITITDNGYKQGDGNEVPWGSDLHELTITGSAAGNGQAATNMIDIQGGNPVITLSGVTITMDSTAQDTCLDRFRPPVLLQENQAATIILTGDSTLSGGDQAPGIQINGGASLTIQGSGSLHASSSNHTGGIGAGRVSQYGASGGGNLVIEGGAITASGTGNSGAIGSSYNRTFGSIEVKGGELTTDGSNSSLKADSITISGGTLTGLHTELAAQTVSITGGNIGNSYDGAETDGRTLTRLYFADSTGQPMDSTEVTITEDSNTWTAKTDSEGIITTYLAKTTNSVLAQVDSDPSQSITISDGRGIFGKACTCNDDGTLTVTDPGHVQVVGTSADLPLEAVYTPASTCTLPAGFHGAYENISFAISRIVKDSTTITADQISQYARITGSTLTVYRKDTPYTVCVQAVSGPTEGQKVSSDEISIPVDSQTSAPGEIRLDIAAGPILITETGYTQGDTTTSWPADGNHALTITQSRSGPVANYIQVSADAAITLKNVNLNGSYSGAISAIPESSNFGPFCIYNGAKVELILEGENTLQSTVAAAGLEVYTGSTLTIRIPEGADDNSGKLTAIGNAEAAGIGGSRWRGAGTVNILSGTIDASCSGAYASGIGPGRLQSMEAIEITGGVITNRCGNTADQYNFSLGTSKDGATASVRISGGKIDTNGVGGTSLTITGGYFTADPSDYLPQGYWAVTSTEPGYGYMVTNQPPVETTVVATCIGAPPFTDVEDYASVSGLVEAFSESLLNSWTARFEGPGNKINVQLIFTMWAAEVNLTSEEKATATYQTFLTANIIVNNIPQHRTTGLSNDALNGRDFTVRLPLPEGLKNPVEVICVAKDGARERLTGSDLKIDTDRNWVDVTVNHLCTFIVNASPTNAATIDGASYGTLQEAVNAAADGATITLEQDCTEKITVSGKSLTIDLNGKAYDSDLVSVGANCTKTVSGDKIIVTYTAPYVPSQPSGGSSSSSGDYLVSVAASRNGKVTVSPGRADEGDTVTITVKPDEGYELDTLTVLDKDGDSVKLTAKGGNKYTFTMPGSSVKIRVSFRETAAQMANPFTDVNGSAYYCDAVLWAVANGVTNGTTATTFSPDATVTRAQMVTFLWRAHGSPRAATGSNPFTDMSADAYYYDAVLWAVESGVTNGTTATTFRPNAPVTRAQAVTFQWRAAGSPSVSGGSFGDVAADAYYAGAVNWAVENGVTNGVTATAFQPDTACNRGQIVTFLYRYMA